jgi:hypothetical protein
MYVLPSSFYHGIELKAVLALLLQLPPMDWVKSVGVHYPWCIRPGSNVFFPSCRYHPWQVAVCLNELLNLQIHQEKKQCLPTTGSSWWRG